MLFGNILSDDNLLQIDSRYTNNFYPESVIDIYWPTKSKIIVGPNATFNQNNTTTGVSPIYAGSSYINYLFYPGCKVNGQDITANNHIIIGPQGKIYFNRFIKADNAKIGNCITCEYFSKEFNTLERKENNGYYQYYDYSSNTNVFPNCYFEIRSNSNVTGFTTPDKPLCFNETSKILEIDKDNEWAKYDITCWKECAINNENYGFNIYNTEDNIDKYINVDNANELFYSDTVQSNTDNLILNTNTLYLGLI